MKETSNMHWHTQIACPNVQATACNIEAPTGCQHRLAECAEHVWHAYMHTKMSNNIRLPRTNLACVMPHHSYGTHQVHQDDMHTAKQLWSHEQLQPLKQQLISLACTNCMPRYASHCMHTSTHKGLSHFNLESEHSTCTDMHKLHDFECKPLHVT